MNQNIEQLEKEGYTVIKNVFTKEECEKLMEVVRSDAKLGYSKNMLRRGKSLYFEALTKQKLMALAQYSLGSDFILMQYSATVQGEGGSGYQPSGKKCWGLHSDQPLTNLDKFEKLYNAIRDRNHLLTCCIILSDDGYSVKSGATYVVPESHKLRRFPTA